MRAKLETPVSAAYAAIVPGSVAVDAAGASAAHAIGVKLGTALGVARKYSIHCVGSPPACLRAAITRSPPVCVIRTNNASLTQNGVVGVEVGHPPPDSVKPSVDGVNAPKLL